MACCAEGLCFLSILPCHGGMCSNQEQSMQADRRNHPVRPVNEQPRMVIARQNNLLRIGIRPMCPPMVLQGGSCERQRAAQRAVEPAVR